MRTKLPGTPEPDHYWTGYQGLQLAGDVFGDGNAPAVFLLHGGGQTRHAWRGTGERLAAAGFRAVALDARGHGDSAWEVDGTYTLESMARDIRAVADALSVPRPVLVGASMGGLASLTAIGMHIVDPSALVLVDIVPAMEEGGRENVRNFMLQKPEGFANLEEVAQAIASYQPHRPRPRNLDGLAKNVRLDSTGRYRWHWDTRFMSRSHADSFRQDRLKGFAARVKCPALLIRGALSDIVSDAGVQDFQRLCPHSEYVNVADASHMVAGDRNDIFGDALIEFLVRVLSPQA